MTKVKSKAVNKKAAKKVVDKRAAAKSKSKPKEVKVIKPVSLYNGQEFSVRNVERSGQKLKEVSLQDGSIELCSLEEFNQRVR